MMIRRIPFLLFAAFVVSACTEMATNATGPEEGLPSFARVKTTTGPVCKTIDFSGFSHGDLVTTVASGFGFDITLSVTPSGARSTTTLRAWDVNTTEPRNLQDLDLIWNRADAECPGCEGLGIVILIEDKQGFDHWGDSPDGGFIDLTGFSGHGVFLIRSYVALDQDGDEDAIRLFVDGTEDGASSGLGNGSVETVVPNQKAFTDEARFVIDGSGAVDDIEICQAPEGATGRMTGGGKQTNVDGVSITRGFTIHCDIALSNNIEINWAGGNKWHLDKPLTHAECFDDGSLDPVPPASPFDTFIGEGTGSLNGEEGSVLRFVFVDAGEPGRNDRAMIQIWAPGDDPAIDTPVLDVSGFLERGNIQAHFDQPHKTR